MKRLLDVTSEALKRAAEAVGDDTGQNIKRINKKIQNILPRKLIEQQFREVKLHSHFDSRYLKVF